MGISKKKLALISVVLGTLVVLKIAQLSYAKPLYNWDTLPYIALVLNLENSNLNEVHQQTFAVAREQVPVGEYRLMTDTAHLLRKELIRSPEKFFQFTSFFRIKPLYIGLIFIAHKAGVQLVKAPVLISVVASVGIFLILCFWLSRSLTYVLSVIISLCIVVTPPVLEAARLATPDTLSSLFLLIACYLMLSTNSSVWIVIVLTLALLTRIDNILFIIVLFPIYWVYARKDLGLSPRMLPVGVTLSWIIATIVVMSLSNFQNGFDAFYGGLSDRLNPLNMIVPILQGLKTLSTSHLVLVVVICLFIMFYKKEFKIQSIPRRQSLFLGLITAVVIKFIFFPDLTTRLFLPAYLISIVFIFLEVGNLRKNAIKKLTSSAD